MSRIKNILKYIFYIVTILFIIAQIIIDLLIASYFSILEDHNKLLASRQDEVITIFNKKIDEINQVLTKE